MTTILPRSERLFLTGYAAYEDGEPRTQVDTVSDPEDRTHWLAGWDDAAKADGTLPETTTLDEEPESLLPS